MRFQRLESIRGFAACYVCLGHIALTTEWPNLLKLPFRFGQEAVIVFFILSGFVISWTTTKQVSAGQYARTYYYKRFLRIYTVWVPLLIALMGLELLSKGDLERASFLEIAGNALMLQDFGNAKPAVICEPMFGNAPLWSLHYEWWFYMLFPFLLCFRDWKKRTHAVGISAVISSCIYAIAPNPISRVLVYFAVWWIGVHAANTLRANGNIRFRDVLAPMIYVLLATIPLLILCWFYAWNRQPVNAGTHPVLETRHLISSVILVGMAFLWRRYRWVGFPYSVGPFFFIAPISFSLYAIHYKSIAHASYLRFIGSPLIEFALYLTTTILFCTAVEVFFYPKLRSLKFAKN